MGFCNLLTKVSRGHRKLGIATLGLGDTVCFYIALSNRNKQRMQVYKGVLISRTQTSRNSKLTVRRFTNEFRIERNFNSNSTTIQNIRVLRKAKVRRAKLYYLRSVSGKSAYLRERLYNLSTCI